MGNRVRNFRILEALARRADLTAITLVHDRATLDDPGPLPSFAKWIPVLASHRRSLAGRVRWHLAARWSSIREGLHRETFFQSLPALGATVRAELERFPYDLVHVAYWYSLRHWPNRPRPPIWVVDTHDVQYERHQDILGHHSPRERAAELRELSRYDRILAITERDRGEFERALPGGPPVTTMPMGLDLAHWTADGIAPARPTAPRAIFFGNLAAEVNASAAKHLIVDLAPRVVAVVPGFELALVGGGADPSLHALAQRGGRESAVELTGFVADLRPWILAARAVALPLRAGSGQRSRVLEALALGVPVVAYPEAIAGLELGEGEGLRLANSADEFVAELARLLEDPAAASALGQRGREAIAARYSWEQTYGRFPSLYEEWIREAGLA